MITIRDIGDITEPVLVFGGVYSNLEAFEALCHVAEARGIPPQRMIHSGDIIAYGADPAACAERLRALDCPAIQGNVEAQLADGALDCGCGFEEGTSCDALSMRWFSHARERVPQMLCTWMGELPDHITFSMSGVNARIVHGAPRSVNRFLYGPEPDKDYAEELASVPEQLIIAGHSGFPFYRRFDDRGWLNTGAIGIPADDGTPRTWFAILEPAETGIRISLEALTYDHIPAITKLREAGLPEPYAVAMQGGPVPNRDTLPEALKARAGRKYEFEPDMINAVTVSA